MVRIGRIGLMIVGISIRIIWLEEMMGGIRYFLIGRRMGF